MKLITLVEDFVANPEKLKAFKQDPEAYISSQKPALRRHLRSLLESGIIREVGTVMKLSVLPRVGLATDDTDDGSIMFDDMVATLKTRTTFFAENPLRVRCRLLGHSYIQFVENEGGTRKKVAAFDLHLCYVNPDDPDDQPQVLYITSPKRMEKPIYNLGDVEVDLEITSGTYALVPADFPLEVQVVAPSSYQPRTEALVLSLFHPNDPLSKQAK